MLNKGPSSTSDKDTFFAPAKRLSGEAVSTQSKNFDAPDALRILIDSTPEVVAVLNEQRQIVYANRTLVAFARKENMNEICGMRLGEVVGCIHSGETEAGCGTSKYCIDCGAVKSMLTCLGGSAVEQECRVVVNSGEAYDFRLRNTPLQLNGEKYIIVALSDIAHEKRRHALERIFFHDVLNTASGLHGLASILPHLEPGDTSEIEQLLTHTTRRLINEIQAQRDLISAENDDLKTQFAYHSTGDLLQSQTNHFQYHDLTRNRNIVLNIDDPEMLVWTDATLAGRVICNMIINALEATAPGCSIILRARRTADQAVIEVHNDGTMEPEVQRQVFHRSFSTKQTTRGLGTYSMKLLTERFLKGHVDFDSTPETGTTFRAFFPLQEPAEI
ncbi:histidine kinase [candidate division BRC1 bacterium HGW-BRC1-1]|jgi:hypothetical protein|nr:MAG: histidine kinase [candidate division BRC1 bacterium HGW-BRC1-1]